MRADRTKRSLLVWALPKKEGVCCVDWGFKSISGSCFPNPRNMANQISGPATPLRQVPKISFRVLIIGRANAGKTSIMQRICDTTQSPVVYRKMYDKHKAYEQEIVSIPTFL